MGDNVIFGSDGWWYNAQTGERIGRARIGNENMKPDNELSETKLRELLNTIHLHVLDIYHVAANVFYVSFDKRITFEDRARLEACNLTCDDGRSPLRNRYMITFAPSDDDESEAPR